MQVAHSSTMTRKEEREKATSDSEHQGRRIVDSLLRNLKPSTALGHRDKPERTRWSTPCQYRHPPFCTLQKRNQRTAGNTCPFIHLSKYDRLPSHGRNQRDTVTDSNAIVKHTKAGGSSLQEPTPEIMNIRAKGILERQKALVGSRHQGR